mgnify:CR=1 FL=1
MGPMSKHGFVRTTAWTVVSANGPSATLRFTSNDHTYKQWPHHFTLDYIITIEYDHQRPVLVTELVFRNLDDDVSTEFAAALHSYFGVDNIACVRVRGLGTPGELKYLDNTQQRKTVTEMNDVIKIEGEVDRIYLQCNERAVIENVSNNLNIIVDTPLTDDGKNGFTDKVVWNPYIERCKTIGDLHADDYVRFVCVEAARTVPKVCVGGGGVWRAGMRLYFAKSESML